MNTNRYMNPYLAGFLLGLVLLATIYITGRGLGASGAVKDVVVSVVKSAAPEHYSNTRFYQEYAKNNPQSPWHSWLVFEVMGMFVGAFLSGVLADRVALKLEKGPLVSSRFRAVTAVIGGMLFGFGSQLGRGCTSGAALSGMAVMSLGGMITMLSIFGSAYTIAYFVRKLWIK
jgi:uncharacterized membrane protein YedE/YeeE